MPAVRGFDPSRVQRKHIAPVTFVYGDDAPGIVARCVRFTEILEENGEHPSIYNSIQEAIGYIESGDMFSDSVTVVIRDISDVFKSTNGRLLSRLINSLENYDDNSTFVLCAVTSKDTTSSLARFISFIDKIGGISRRVSAPTGYELRKWIMEYGKTMGKNITTEQANKIATACKGDIDLASRVVDYLYQALDDFNIKDLEYWLETEDVLTPFQIADMMRTGDMLSIACSIPRYKNYTEFLLNARMAIDYMLRSNIKNSDENGKRKLIAMHQAVTDALARETGVTRVTSNEKQFLCKLKMAFDGYEN